MSPLPPEDLLRKVLELEQRQSFQNRAMAGGLSAFARSLHSRAQSHSTVPQAALLLASYDADDPVSRRAAVAAVLAVLDPASKGIPAEVSVPPDETPPKAETDPPPNPRAAPPRPTQRKAISTKPASLNSLLIEAKGVPAKPAEILTAAGYRTIADLLYYFPREHLDYRRRDRIGGLQYGERTTIIATIESVRTRHIKKNLSTTTAMVSDDSGRISVTWFNQPYLEKSMRIGRRIAITGEADVFEGRLTFSPRDYEWVDDSELTHAARLVPIYPLHKGLFQKPLRTLMHKLVETHAPQLPEHLPEYVHREFDLPRLGPALASFHFPRDQEEAEKARRRLAFDEILAIQLGLKRRKLEWEASSNAPALMLADEERTAFMAQLPFEPTAAQKRVMSDLETSLKSTCPMSRLIQGDVGSGKTVVAALALFAAAKRGYQSAIMAPTEILAQQHFASLQRWLQPLDVSVELLTGSTKAKERVGLLERASGGEIDVLVGTHALFQEGVELSRLAVAVVDEQHRFGVGQRSRLRQKGISPHLLAMTATPIPRSLQLTLYGDLDISVIDELPPGRVPIETRLFRSTSSPYDLVREQVAAGHQAFVVCPVIDESQDADMKSVVAEHRQLQSQTFPSLKIGLLHGRMPPKEKDRVLADFRDGVYQILVATTVIEVGIDIPNATAMVIRDAQRFGLAQLHQLRGRIGRGGEKSYCMLVSQATQGPTYERLQAVEESQDGFKLAEKDLELRGPGEFWGTRQSGIPALKVASPSDVHVLEQARKAVSMILDRDRDLSQPEHFGLREHVDRFWAEEAELH